MRRVLILAVALAGAVAAPALAHGTFVDARPLPGVEVGGTVDEVEFLFPEAVRTTDAVITVTAPDGSSVPTAGGMDTSVEGLVRQRIEPLSIAGEHRIDYRIPSADGEVFEGAFVFTWDPAADPLEPLPFGRGDGLLVVAGIGGAVATIVLGALAIRIRNRRHARSAETPAG